MLTLDEIEKALPANMKNAATPALVAKINSLAHDPEAAEYIRDNFVSYTSVMKEGRFTLTDYLNAVTYVSFRLMGLNSKDSFVRSFPQRYAGMVSRGLSEKDISSLIAAYNKGKLVNLLQEQVLVPSWVLNHDTHQKAINKLVVLMNTAKSEFVQMQSAATLLDKLSKPKEVKATLSVELAETSGMNELKAALLELGTQQQALISAGAKTGDIAAQPIFDVATKELDDR